MPTNLDLDDRLIERVRRIGRFRTKKEAVNAALADFVRHHEQLRILGLFGTVEFDPRWNAKAARRKR